MKTLIEKYLPYLIVVLILGSCNPFITPELRHSNKCNRKLEKVLKKCPELKDTVFVDVPFKVIVPEIVIKDSISVRVDTVELLKYITKEQIRYIVRSISIDTMYVDSLYRLQISLYNGVLSWDVEIAERTVNNVVNVPIRVVKPIKLTIFEQVLNFFGSFWTWFIIILIIIALFYLAKTFFK